MRIGIVSALLCLTAIGIAAADDANAAIRQSTEIPAQGLGPALERLAKERDLQVVYRSDVVGRAQSHGASGNLTLSEALGQILAGTGLTYQYLEDKAVTIVPASADTVKAPAEAVHSTSTPIVQSGDADPRPREASATTPGMRVAQVGSARAGKNSDTSGSNEVSGGSLGALEEIIVTARRREENLQTVPIAVTVISQQALSDNNVQTFQALASLVPSMTAMSTLTRDTVSVSIRGQGTNGISGLPGVVAYLNEAPIPSDYSGDLAGGPGLLFDLENVQVLKGPQGTLFGRNSVGGALLLQSARPTNEFGGSVQAGYGNYNDREVNGAINIPLVSDILLTRIAFTGQLRDGFTFLQSEPGHPGGIDADNRDYWAARGTVTFRPNSTVQNDAIVSYSHYTSNGSPPFLVVIYPGSLFSAFGGAPYAALLAQQQALGSRTHLPIDNEDVSYGSNLSVTDVFRYTPTDNLTLRNIFSYDRDQIALQFDADDTALPIVELPYATPEVENVSQFTEEAQLLGNSFGGHLNWTLGAFFLDDVPPSDFTLLRVRLLGLPGIPNDSESKPSSKSTAIYSQGTYDLSALLSGLKLTAGARYTWDDRSEDDRGGVFGSSICTAPSVSCDVTTHNEKKSKALTWTLGLDYQAQPNTLLYLTSRRGYRAGGFNGAGEPGFDPEYVVDVELGVKSNWTLASIPMRTNADVYYQDYRDIQVQQTLASVAGGLVAITQNAARARIWGAELEETAQLTRDLQLGVNFDYSNLRYTEFDAGVPEADSATLIAGRTFNNPPYKYGVSARYHVPVTSQAGDFSVKANWNWQATSSALLGTAAALPGGKIPDYGLLNLSVDLNRIDGAPLDLSLFASNLLDKVYLAYAQTSPLGYAHVRYGEPRMYGIRLRYRFGAEAK